MDSLLAVVEHSKADISRYLTGIEVSWFSPTEIVDAWTQSTARFVPEVVFLAKQMNSNNNAIHQSFVSCSDQWAESAASNGTSSLIWEYAPNVFVVPILSNTISTDLN